RRVTCAELVRADVEGRGEAVDRAEDRKCEHEREERLLANQCRDCRFHRLSPLPLLVPPDAMSNGQRIGDRLMNPRAVAVWEPYERGLTRTGEASYRSTPR